MTQEKSASHHLFDARGECFAPLIERDFSYLTRDAIPYMEQKISPPVHFGASSLYLEVNADAGGPSQSWSTERHAKLCRHVASVSLTLRQAATLRIEAPFPTVRRPMSSLSPKGRLQTRPRATCVGTTVLRPRGLLRHPNCRQTSRS